MHLSFLHKYVIISITYLTPKPAKVCLGSHSLRLCIREDGGGHRPRTLPPTPFPDDASNQSTYNPYINIPACQGVKKWTTASQKVASHGLSISSKVQNDPVDPSSLRPASASTVKAAASSTGGAWAREVSMMSLDSATNAVP